MKLNASLCAALLLLVAVDARPMLADLIRVAEKADLSASSNNVVPIPVKVDDKTQITNKQQPNNNLDNVVIPVIADVKPVVVAGTIPKVTRKGRFTIVDQSLVDTQKPIQKGRFTITRQQSVDTPLFVQRGRFAVESAGTKPIPNVSSRTGTSGIIKVTMRKGRRVFQANEPGLSGISIKTIPLRDSGGIVSSDGLQGLSIVDQSRPIFIGFHGTSESAANSIISDKFSFEKNPLLDGKNQYGPGLYATKDHTTYVECHFLTNHRAFHFAKEQALATGGKPQVLEVWVNPPEASNSPLLQVHSFPKEIDVIGWQNSDEPWFPALRQEQPASWIPKVEQFVSEFDFLTGPHLVEIGDVERLSIQIKVNPRLLESGRIQFAAN